MFVDGSASGHHTPADLMTRCQQHGYEWVALELDDPHSRDANLAVWDSCLEQAHLRGMKFGGWVTEGGNIFVVPGDADLAIAEIEGPGDYEGVVNVLNGVGAGPMPRVPLGVVTNFNSLTYDRARILTQAGFTCLPEAYLNENDSATPDQMDRVARNLGWATSQPVAGVYPTALHPVVPSYAPWASWPLVDYLGEYVV